MVAAVEEEDMVAVAATTEAVATAEEVATTEVAAMVVAVAVAATIREVVEVAIAATGGTAVTEAETAITTGEIGGRSKQAEGCFIPTCLGTRHGHL